MMKSSRVRFLFLLLLPLFFLLSLPLLFPGFKFFHPFNIEKTGAYTVESEIEDIINLNTLEMKVRLIFPYDFVENDFDWSLLIPYFGERKEPVPYLKKNLEIYRAATDAGLDPLRRPYDFIVLSIAAKGGVDLRGLEGGFVRLEEKKGEKNIFLNIPDYCISEYYIEDGRGDKDFFPDIRISPSEWQILLTFLTPHIKDRILNLGLVEKARKNGEELMVRLLKGKGFDNIYFEGDNS